MKTKIVRIDISLAEELDKISKKNEIKFREASREVANMIKQNKNRKVIKEIKF